MRQKKLGHGEMFALWQAPIVVPCHRVPGSEGALTGYSGGRGIATKEWLLDFERPRSV
ncbi:MAG TPA: MGMT family protein [Desulfuromonadales bacterium]|nr:MGMT family protein [Desulfuromonadales bacterium]